MVVAKPRGTMAGFHVFGRSEIEKNRPKGLERTAGKMFKKALALLSKTSGVEADKPVGAKTANRKRRAIFYSAGAPATSADGQSNGDWVVDITNDKVYWQTAANTFIELTQTS